MNLDVFQVDAFTSEPFKGNPAAVCLIPPEYTHHMDETLMLAIAREMAVSETAFLFLHDMRLRWFTPEVEVALCGHGTLSVAHVLKELGRIEKGETIAFSTLSGVLRVTVSDNDIVMDFPATEVDTSAQLPQALLSGLGLTESQVVASGLFDTKYFIEVSDEAIVRSLSPDFSALKQLPGRSVLISARAAEGTDIISRYFAPWVGVNEDPVTGSAHCALATYWGNKLDSTTLSGYQASARGGQVTMTLCDDNRVKLSGQAVTVLKGQLMLPSC